MQSKISRAEIRIAIDQVNAGNWARQLISMKQEHKAIIMELPRLVEIGTFTERRLQEIGFLDKETGDVVGECPDEISKLVFMSGSTYWKKLMQ